MDKELSMEIKTLVNEGLKREFNVIVSQDEVSKAINENVKKLSREVKIQGFRPGKIPEAVIKQRYMPTILQDALEALVKETSQKLMQEQNIRPALQPTIDVVKFEENSKLEYKISIELLPEIKLPDFTKITLEKLVCDIQDKDVNDYLDKVAQSGKNFVESDKKKAEQGDAVLINYRGTLNGVAFDGGTAEDHQLELGSKSFIDGFEDQLVGSKPGEHRVIKVKFPEQYHAENLAGKDVEFAVDVKSILTAKPLEINDDLAKRFGLEDLEALKNKVREEITKDTDLAAKEKMKKELFDKLEKICDYEVPSGMINSEFNALWNKVQEMKKTNPQFSEGKTDDELKTIYQRLSKRRVALGLLLAKIAGDENIVADSESIKSAIYAQARNYPGQEHVIVEYFRKNPESLEQLKGPIIEDKTVDFILEKTSFKDKKISLDKFKDAVKINEDDF
jgi:trigger factor